MTNQKTIILALASAASALATAAAALAESCTDAPASVYPEVMPPGTANKPRRGPGRPPAQATSEPVTATAEAPAAQPPADPVVPTNGTAKTYEQLRAIIEPVVKNGQGEEVKKVIAKYAPNLKELADLPQHHPAFEKDITALTY